MRGRCFTAWAAMAAVIALAPVAAHGQDDYAAPRNAFGQPDLSGIWTNNSATPLERPEQLAGRATLTDEELAELTQTITEFRDAEQAGDLLGDRLIQQALGNAEFQDFDVVTGNYNAFWLVERHLDNRTSLVVDPPDGRIPALTEAAAARAAERRGLRGRASVRRTRGPHPRRPLPALRGTAHGGGLQQLLPAPADADPRGHLPGDGPLQPRDPAR